MLDTTLKAKARRIAGRGANTTAGALRKAADASAWAAAALADSLDEVAATLAPRPSRKTEKWIGGALVLLVVAGIVAYVVRRRRTGEAAPQTTATDLEAVREQRSAS